MWDGRDILDAPNLDASRFNSAQGSFSTCAYAPEVRIHHPKPGLIGHLRGILRRDLPRIRRVFLSSTKAYLPGRAPGYRIACRIREGDDNIIEGRLDIHTPLRRHFDFLSNSTVFLCCCHITLKLFTWCFFLAGDGFTASFSGTGICPGTLPTHRQAQFMSDTPIAPNLNQTPDVHLHFRPKLPFYNVLVLYHGPNARHLIFRPLRNPFVGVYLRFGQHLPGITAPDAVDIPECIRAFLIPNQVYTRYPCHISLAAVCISDFSY
jgi:hypothetical protein